MRPIHSVPVKESLVALTFDDGPSPDLTPKILDAEHNMGTVNAIPKIIETWRAVQYQFVTVSELLGKGTL